MEITMDIYLVALGILALLAISDLIVGVSNDAVNFMNSSLGSNVAPRHVIMIIASLGMLAGVTFSRGMMEVARKGIFHPKFFTMPELLVIFLAVMLTDILLLDLYNTFGLPTSTTVSIVFELLGAAVAVSLIKITMADEGLNNLVKYINTGRALMIITGILLSVVVAFIVGAIFQFLTRLLFTFDFGKRLKRYGSLWGGAALAFIVYFILIKGAKGSTFITKETLDWVKSNTGIILLGSFIFCALLLQLLMMVAKVNILKPIILVGTFALAMAFAANDLVNFIGVPLAGYNAYKIALTTPDVANTPMLALQEATPTDTLLLLIAGLIMVVTLWFSRKARTVSATELSLGRQEEGSERFDSIPLSRAILRMVTGLGDGIRRFIPQAVIKKVNSRFDASKSTKVKTHNDEAPAFDLVRASVNLMVASILISIATSMKLPLSTTYVTFMVSMGTSFSDRAWGMDSAVYRITGVLTVVGGWFFTAFMAFSVSAIFGLIIFHLRAVGVLLVVAVAAGLLLRNRIVHKKREKDAEDIEVFNLKKVTDGKYAVSATFEHTGLLLHEIMEIIEDGYEGLANQNRSRLRMARKKAKRAREWVNIIVANTFKTFRLLQKDEPGYTERYIHTITVLQEIADAQRDVIRRAYHHVGNQHKPLLPVQLEELKTLKDLLVDLLGRASKAMKDKEIDGFKTILGEEEELKRLAVEYDHNQVERIRDESSKTRLSILFYGLTRDYTLMAEGTVELMKIYQESFKL